MKDPTLADLRMVALGPKLDEKSPEPAPMVQFEPESDAPAAICDKAQPAQKASSAETAKGDEVQTPAKKRARVEKSEALTPQALTSSFGGKQSRASGCACCECPRHHDQRGRLCPHCQNHVKKVLGHQRIDEFLENKTAVAEVRALTEAVREKEASDDNERDKKAMMSRLEKILKQVPRFEKMLDRLETLLTDVN